MCIFSIKYSFTQCSQVSKSRCQTENNTKMLQSKKNTVFYKNSSTILYYIKAYYRQPALIKSVVAERKKEKEKTLIQRILIWYFSTLG